MKSWPLILILIHLNLLMPAFQARPSGTTSHVRRSVKCLNQARDIPLGPTRDCTWEPTDIPVEPLRGTCGLNDTMTTSQSDLNDPTGKSIHCQSFQIDMGSIFSWRFDDSTICYDTDTQSTIQKADCGPGGSQKLNVTELQPAVPHSYGRNLGFLVQGLQYSENMNNFGGFEDVGYNLALAQNISFPRNSDPVLRDFTYGAGNTRANGMLGFGQLRNSSMPSWNELHSPGVNWTFRTSPLIESMSSWGGPLPIWSVAMPRDGDTGKIVIGSYISNATAQPMASNADINIPWNLSNVTCVENQTAIGADMGHYVPVVGWEFWKMQGNLTTPGTTGKGVYLIDSLSDVIMTDIATASTMATYFDPQAFKGAEGVWEVSCNATVSSLGGPTVQGESHQRTFLISDQDMIVKRSEGKCISTFQETGSDGPMSLGWPFLRNTIITFNITSTPSTMNITQRALLSHPELMLTDSTTSMSAASTSTTPMSSSITEAASTTSEPTPASSAAENPVDSAMSTTAEPAPVSSAANAPAASAVSTTA